MLELNIGYMEGRLDFRFGFRKELRVLQKLLIKVDVICLARD